MDVSRVAYSIRPAALALGLIFLTGAAQAQFSTSDLAGTWSLYTRYDTPPVNDPGWIRGTVNVDAGGDITGVSFTRISGTFETITGTSLSTTPSGDVSGTLTTGEPSSNDLVDFHLDLAADLAVGADTDDDGYVSLVTAVRRSGTFSEADFAGNWYLYTHWDERFDPHSPGWTRAEVTVNAFGTVTNTLSVAESDGAPAPLTGVDLNITAAGLVTISFPPTLTDSNLQIRRTSRPSLA